MREIMGYKFLLSKKILKKVHVLKFFIFKYEKIRKESLENSLILENTKKHGLVIYSISKKCLKNNFLKISLFGRKKPKAIQKPMI